MFVGSNSNLDIVKRTLRASIIWSICITLVESFHVVTSTSARYLEPWDVLFIAGVLFLAYFILWFLGLTVLAFLLKKSGDKIDLSEENFLIALLCIALFSYHLFWIMNKVAADKLYVSIYGIFLFIVLFASAALTAIGAFKILIKLLVKRHFENFRLKLSAFTLSALAYLIAYVYLKSSADQGLVQLPYSVALLVVFCIVTILLFFFINKFALVIKRIRYAETSSKAKPLLGLIVFLSIIIGITYHGTGKTLRGTARPNVLLISIDTLRADHVSAYGKIKKETSPNIDKLGEAGYVFKKAYSTSSWTLPAHASMFTGLFPSAHHADRSDNQKVSRPVDPLPASMQTLAESMKASGYQTAGIISNPFVSSAFGMDQGFDFFDDHVDLFENVRYLSLRDCSVLFKLLLKLRIIDRNDYDGEERVQEVNRKALKWLEDHKNKTEPFFLFLHYNEPHFTYEPPWPYNKDDTGKTIEYFQDIVRLNQGFYSLSSYGLNNLITLYDGEISYLDHHLGLLFDKLEKWNLLDNTLIIITSDHGESFNEHEIWQHGNSLYEEQIRIPMIFYYPKLVPKGRIDNDHFVQLIDLMPTILDITKIHVPDNIQGRSLVPIFQGKSENEFNMAFAEIKADINWKSQNKRYGEGMRAIIHGDWKYILSNNGKEELFMLDMDPYEKDNLVLKERSMSQKMKKMLASMSDMISHQKDDKSGKIDSGRLEQLRSLGYLK